MPMPKPLTIPFARDALSQFINEIPDTPQAGADPQLASWSEGFGPITMQPLHSGGKPPEGPDFNGILSALSKHIVYQNGGGIYKFSQEYVDKTGGYDKDSVLIGDDGNALWVSLADNNTENFNTATPPTEWVKISFAGVEQQIQDILGMIATKADKTTQVIAGTGLSGGGNLQANRTLSVNYGTTAGTAAQGNDTRITGAAQKSANLSDLASASAARQNLGLGAAATRNVVVSNADTTAGRVVTPGWMGLGGPAVLATQIASDWDDIDVGGFYQGQGLSNSPFGTEWAYVICLEHVAKTYVAQVAYSLNSPVPKSASRRRLNGVWSPWQTVCDTGNILTTTGQSALYPMTQKAVTDAINSATSHPSMAGSIALNGTTNNTVVMADIVTELDLEIGDVIRIDTGAYNKLHTVESITNDDSIIVNYEHAGNRGDGSLKLPVFTGQATVTRVAKWFNAPIGLGQADVRINLLTGSRRYNTVYTNTTGRPMSISTAALEWPTANINLMIDGASYFRSRGASGGDGSVCGIIPAGSTYEISTPSGGGGGGDTIIERR